MKFSIIGGWSNVLNLLAKTRFSDPNDHLLGQSPAFFVLQVEDDFEASSALPMIWSKAENPVSFGKGCLKKDVFFCRECRVVSKSIKIHQNSQPHQNLEPLIFSMKLSLSDIIFPEKDHTFLPTSTREPLRGAKALELWRSFIEQQLQLANFSTSPVVQNNRENNSSPFTIN